MRRLMVGASLGALAYPCGLIIGRLIFHRTVLNPKG